METCLRIFRMIMAKSKGLLVLLRSIRYSFAKCTLALQPEVVLLCMSLFKHSAKSSMPLHLIDENALPVASGSSEISRTPSRRCYPYTRNSEHSWCWSSSLSMLVRFSIHDAAMLPGLRHSGLTTRWALLTCSLNWELRRDHGVYGTPS